MKVSLRNSHLIKNDASNHLASSISFNSEINNKSDIKKEQQINPDKKNYFSLKSITNVMGVALGVGAISAYVIMNAKKNPAEKLIKAADKLKQKIRAVSGKIEESELHKNLSQKPNWGYRAGLKVNKWIENGEELANNLVYGFGTVVVMPLVIMFSPIGKKKSSKEDKIFTILRQPLSFVTMFSMQLTVDKFFKEIVPNLVKKNTFEDNYLTGEKYTNGKDKYILENLKYNSAPIKENIIEGLKKYYVDKSRLTGNLLEEIDTKTVDAIDQIFKIKSPEVAKEALKDFMDKSTNLLDRRKLETLERMDLFLKVKGREKFLTQTLVIATNVLFSAPVGCTLLNVIYGKAMKLRKPQDKNTPPEKIEKGGHK